jgi:hypothetical protein
MAKRAGTIRGRLFKTPLAAHHRFEYVRELLNWAYAKNRTAEELEEGFICWFGGVYPEQLARLRKRTRSLATAKAADRVWHEIQAHVRQGIETVIQGRERKGPLLGVAVGRALTKWKAPDGKTYYHYGADTHLETDPHRLVAQTLEVFFSDLSGVNTEAMKECGECGRYFICKRPTRGRYCSVACRNLGYLKSHGFKPRKKGKSKGGNHEPTETA